MPQLQINQGPQDALLYDNSRSYFTNVGYVRTSNFQVEYRDVDPQNTATLGSTLQFIIPKAADLLGPVDLMLEFNTTDIGSSNTIVAATKDAFIGWVESLGYAMIEKIVFSVGSHDIETITGEQLYITNELMRSDENRFSHNTILKTGRPLINVECATTAWSPIFEDDTLNANNSSRLICAQYYDGTATTYHNYAGKKLIVPLGLFFTKHPSQYFPLDAIAGSNDVRISVKLRTLNELLVARTEQTVASGVVSESAGQALTKIPAVNIASSTCKLRCHYVHVTGPEASMLMNKEHVRLLKLWHHYPTQATITHQVRSSAVKTKLFDFEIPFLHPVSEIIVIIRKTSEMSNSTDATPMVNAYDRKMLTKNYFALQGGNKDPNVERHVNSTIESGTEGSNWEQAYLRVDNFKLTLNGQERHPSLASSGLDRDYLMNRLLPMLHSNSSSTYSHLAMSTQIAATAGASSGGYLPRQMDALSELLDRKEIYVYPLSLNPEGANPSGAVNFSKVSHGKLTIEGYAIATTASTQVEYQCDVFGVHYNWLQIKDGRAITSFA